LNWSGSSGAAGYDLSSATSASGPFAPLKSNLTVTSYMDTNAVTGQTNYYLLTAVNGCATSASSTVIGVYLPKPALMLANAGSGALNLSWPAWASDWSLYFTTNLNPPVVWHYATNVVGSNAGRFNVTITPGSGTRFFRLGAP
jgi:hypothetical protein